MVKKETLLIVEDEADIRELISFNLEMSGYDVIKAGDGEAGLSLARRSLPDLILLDIMLPGMDGLQVCRRLKSSGDTRAVPVMMLTAKGEEDDQVTGFDVGADDYVTKPFSPRVLIARVKALLRRCGPARETTSNRPVEIHGIAIDSARHEVRVSGRPVVFSATEFSILRFLAENPGWVFSRQQIIDAVKGEDYPVTARSVDVQILGIRKKLADKGESIETVRGIGYRMRGV